MNEAKILDMITHIKTYEIPDTPFSSSMIFDIKHKASLCTISSKKRWMYMYLNLQKYIQSGAFLFEKTHILIFQAKRFSEIVHYTQGQK